MEQSVFKGNPHRHPLLHLYCQKRYISVNFKKNAVLNFINILMDFEDGGGRGYEIFSQSYIVLNLQNG